MFIFDRFLSVWLWSLSCRWPKDRRERFWSKNFLPILFQRSRLVDVNEGRKKWLLPSSGEIFFLSLSLSLSHTHTLSNTQTHTHTHSWLFYLNLTEWRSIWSNLNAKKCVRSDRQTDGWMDRWTDRQMDGQINRQMNGRMDRITDWWMEEWTDLQTNGWTDRQIDKQTYR